MCPRRPQSVIFRLQSPRLTPWGFFDTIYALMLMIRLQRVGRKNEPSFRLVLTDSKNAAQSGKFLEILGSHSFRKDGTILKADRIKHWVSMGAQVSDTAHNLLVTNKVLEGKKKNVLPKKSVPKKEEVAA